MSEIAASAPLNASRIERSDEGRRSARGRAMIENLGNEISRRSVQRDVGPRRRVWLRPSYRRRERSHSGDGAHRAGRVMTMFLGGRMARVADRRRMRAEGGVAERHAGPASASRHRSGARDGRRDLREQSDAKQQLNEMAAQHGDSRLDPDYLLTILNFEAPSLPFLATIPSPRRLSKDKISVKRHLCHTCRQCV